MREVHPDCSPHDPRLIELLTDPIAGPGLVSDLDGHACGTRRCSMTFTAADGQSVLRVESMLAAVAAPLVSRPARNLTALGERPFLTHAAARRTSDIEAVSRPPAPPAPDARGQARGHCVQLLAPRFGMDSEELHHTATQIAAAWALEGYAVLVVQESWAPAPARRQVQGAATATPSSMPDPEAAPFAQHRPLRLLPGNGSLSGQTSYGGRKETATLLNEARRQFDWILFVGCDNTFGLGIRIEESADSYLVVVSTRAYDEYIVATQARDGVAEPRRIPVSAAGSAIAWRHSHLSGLPFDRVPVTGLVLKQPAVCDNTVSSAFAEQVDAELDRLGTPVLTRLPQLASSGPGLRPSAGTVLDHADDAYRSAYISACQPIREALAAAQPCKIPPPVDPWD